jgi:hypothetical protein
MRHVIIKLVGMEDKRIGGLISLVVVLLVRHLQAVARKLYHMMLFVGCTTCQKAVFGVTSVSTPTFVVTTIVGRIILRVGILNL